MFDSMHSFVAFTKTWNWLLFMDSLGWQISTKQIKRYCQTLLHQQKCTLYKFLRTNNTTQQSSLMLLDYTGRLIQPTTHVLPVFKPVVFHLDNYIIYFIRHRDARYKSSLCYFVLYLGEKKQQRDGDRQREMHEKSNEDLSQTEAV